MKIAFLFAVLAASPAILVAEEEFRFRPEFPATGTTFEYEVKVSAKTNFPAGGWGSQQFAFDLVCVSRGTEDGGWEMEISFSPSGESPLPEGIDLGPGFVIRHRPEGTVEGRFEDSLRKLLAPLGERVADVVGETIGSALDRLVTDVVANADSGPGATLIESESLSEGQSIENHGSTGLGEWREQIRVQRTDGSQVSIEFTRDLEFSGIAGGLGVGYHVAGTAVLRDDTMPARIRLRSSLDLPLGRKVVADVALHPRPRTR